MAIQGQGWMTTLKSIATKVNYGMPVTSTVQDAIQHMVSLDLAVVVFLEEDKPVGILTERDIVWFMHSGIGLDSSLCSLKRPLLTVTEDKTLLFGLNLLIDNNIRRVIVVDLQGNFSGVVTQEDLIRHLEGELYRQDARIMDIISGKQMLRTVSAGDSLASAVSMMANYNVGCVLVMDEDKIVGIITERDLLKIAGTKTALSEKVGKFMSQPVSSASIDSSVSDVLDIMRAKHIRRIVINYNDGTPFRVITNRDILRNLENSYLDFLNKKIRHARDILDFLPEVIVEVIDVSGEQIIQWCNRKTKLVFGSDIAHLPITSLIPQTAWSVIYPDIVEKGRIEKTRVEIGDRIFELSASYLKMQREGIIQAILIDVTSEVELSLRDFLTGTFNRRKFEEIIAAEVERVKRYGHLLSICIMDIDHFKLVNDTYGHLAGDQVLQELSSLVAKNIREVDYLIRYGGEEFVVLASDTDLVGMRRLAEKLRKLIESHVFSGDKRISISLGIAQFAATDTTATFFNKADQAMYQAKAQGRNRVEPAG